MRNVVNTCEACGGSRSAFSGQVCRACYTTRRSSRAKPTCQDCGVPVKYASTQRCRPCFEGRPAIEIVRARHEPEPLKHVSLAKLEGAIIKPGIEKHLIPLMMFKGHADLGSWHRKWNLLLSAREHECESLSEISRLQANPQYSQLCLPPKPVMGATLMGFLSRVMLRPDLDPLAPGIVDYARSLMRRPWPLTPVSEFHRDSHSKRMAWWRTLDPELIREREERRARRIERSAARAAERAAEREAARLAREIQRAVRRDEREAKEAEHRRAVLHRRQMRTHRRALLLEHRRVEREARQRVRERERAARQATRERLAREPAKFVLRETGGIPLAYPFLIHDGGRPEHTLLHRINAAVPKGVMGDLRADICQDLAVGILCGDFDENDLALPAKEMMARIRKLFPSKWGPLSLDAVVPGTDGLRLIDQI